MSGKYKFPSDYDCNMARTVWERTCMEHWSFRHLLHVVLLLEIEIGY